MLRHSALARLGRYARFFASLPQHTTVSMPALSPTMTQGVIAEWTKKEGEVIKAGDCIAKIETDKATVDFEATDDAIMGKILVPAGEALVGRTIALFVEDASAAAVLKGMSADAVLAALGGGKAAPAAAASAAAPPPPAAADDVGRSCSGLRTVDPEDAREAAAAVAAAVAGLHASAILPSARALLLNSHYAGALPRGTGKDGRITKADVLVAMGQAPASAVAAPAAASAAAAAAAAKTSAAAPPSASAPRAAAPPPSAAAAAAPFVRASSRSHRDVKPSTIRKVIAARLTESKATIPHAYATMDCNLDALTALRARLKDSGVNVSVNDMVIAAAARALRAVPEANAYYDAKRDCIVANGSVDVSVAVATDGGLITPIVKGADALGLAGINAAVKDLAARARAGRLKPEEFQGGTFTISNLGMYGSINEFSAVINPPQACILAVGKGEQRVLVGGAGAGRGSGEPYVSTVMTVQLSSDARVVEAHVAGQFLAAFRGYIQDPTLMFMRELA